MSFNEYLNKVITLAEKLGYNKSTIMCFEVDIRECYDEGLTHQECVEREF